MTSRFGLRFLAALAPAVLLVPAVAHADTLSIDDAAGDAKAVNLAVVFGDLAGGASTDGPFLLDARPRPRATSCGPRSTTRASASR